MLEMTASFRRGGCHSCCRSNILQEAARPTPRKNEEKTFMDKTLAASMPIIWAIWMSDEGTNRRSWIGLQKFSEDRSTPFFQNILGHIEHNIWWVTSAPHMQISSLVERISLLPNVQVSYSSYASPTVLIQLTGHSCTAVIVGHIPHRSLVECSYITRAHLTAPTTLVLTFYSRAKQEWSTCSKSDLRMLYELYECITSEVKWKSSLTIFKHVQK